MDVETCDHPACSCAVTNGKHFCSRYCETASKDVGGQSVTVNSTVNVGDPAVAAAGGLTFNATEGAPAMRKTSPLFGLKFSVDF